MSAILLVVGLALIVGLIVVHEFGHFIIARRGGIEVEEFGIFFPPRLYKRKTKAGWNFTINALPIGGFVKLKGEHDTDTEPGSFGVAPLWIKTKVMVAGIIMNLVAAFVVFTLLAVIGMPAVFPNQYTVKSDTKISRQEVLLSYIEPGSPAAKAGLQAEDQLIAIGPVGHTLTKATTVNNLPALTASYAGQLVTVVYEQAGQEHQVNVRLLTKAVVAASDKTNTPKGYLGVSPTSFTLQRSTWSAPVVAVGLMGQYTGLTFQLLGHVFGGIGRFVAGAITGNTTARQHGKAVTSQQVSQLSGPVGIYAILKEGSALGYQFVLFVVAIISLALALFNVLPIPALDGGRLWMTLIAHAVRRPLNAHVEEVVNVAGLLVLLFLGVLVAIMNVHQYF